MTLFKHLIDVQKNCWFCIDYSSQKNCPSNLTVSENKAYLLPLDDTCVHEILEDT